MSSAQPTANLPVWPTVGHPPLRAARIRAEINDFEVLEVPLIEPEGEGEHLWLRIRKRNRNTTDVAKLLAKLAEIPVRDVSFAGQKDRRAVTEQWFSLYLPGREVNDLAERIGDDQIEILEALRHNRKLRRGALKGNRFRIVLRDCEGDKNAVTVCLQRLTTEGIANYFGEQRFGRNGDNIVKARQMLRGKRRVNNREQRAMLISAARSLVFNDLLALRIQEGNWNQPLPGDLMLLGDGNSLFLTESIDEALLARTAAGEVHPSGPLPGAAGKLEPMAEAARLEQAVAEAHRGILTGLKKLRINASRRALRVMPRHLRHEWLDATALAVSFELPAGSYATALLREITEPY